MWDLIDVFLSQKNHQNTYILAIKEWLLFLGCKEFRTKKAAKALKSASLSDAIKFIEWQKQQGGQLSSLPFHPQKATRANRTIIKRLWLLQHFYAFLKAQDQVKINPFYGAKKPNSKALQKRPTNSLTNEDVRRLFQLEKPIQEQAILASLIGAALRRSELCNLRICDFICVEWQHQFFLRDTKTKQDYYQTIGDELIQYISIWYKIRKLETKDHTEPLFRSNRDAKARAYTTHAIYKMIKRWADKLDLGYRISPHSLRATAITKLLESGVQIDQVRYFARHSKIQNTLDYDKRTNEQMALNKKLKI